MCTYLLVDPGWIRVVEEGQGRGLDVQFDRSDDVYGMDGIRALWVVPYGIGTVGAAVEEPGKCVVGHPKHTVDHGVAFH